MSLFISNPSKQNVVFHFRTSVPKDNSGPMAVEIPSGRQVEIGHGWSPEEREYVIKQIEKRGGRDAAEVHATMGKFLGLLYRDNRPVTEGEIVMGHSAVLKTQEERSVAEATRAALAFDRNANQRVRGKRLARVTQVEVEQEIDPHARRTGDEVTFSLSVDPEGRGDVSLPI